MICHVQLFLFQESKEALKHNAVRIRWPKVEDDDSEPDSSTANESITLSPNEVVKVAREQKVSL